MRVRKLDANGDMVYGHGSADFLIDSPQAVEQAIVTGLKLFRGEFFLNTSAGMPWKTQVLGRGTQGIYDQAVQQQIKSTQGVTQITSYTSTLNPVTRVLAITASGESQYGPWTISSDLSFAPPITTGYGAGGYGQTIVPSES